MLFFSHSMEVNGDQHLFGYHIPQNNKKETHTGLEKHEGE